MLKLHEDFGKPAEFTGQKDQEKLSFLFLKNNLLRGFSREEDEARRLKWPKKLDANPKMQFIGDKDFCSWNIHRD